MHWLIFITGLARTAMWLTGLGILIFRPGRVGDVPTRLELARGAFGLGTLNSTLYTLANAGVWSAGSAATVLNVTSALGTLVVGFLLAGLMASAYGPRNWW
jgi:hypothetical protein